MCDEDVVGDIAAGTILYALKQEMRGGGRERERGIGNEREKDGMKKKETDIQTSRG